MGRDPSRLRHCSREEEDATVELRIVEVDKPGAQDKCQWIDHCSSTPTYTLRKVGTTDSRSWKACPAHVLWFVHQSIPQRLKA
jgi:hypothetical protein